MNNRDNSNYNYDQDYDHYNKQDHKQDRSGSVIRETSQEFCQTVNSAFDEKQDNLVISKNLLIKGALIALGLDLLF